jgi:hypothetical protein
MSQFALLFRSPYDPTFVPTAEQMEAMYSAWGQWLGGLAAQGKLVSAPQLGFNTAMVVGASGTAAGPYTAGSVLMGLAIVEAADAAEAESIGKTCPILHQPEGTVEIRDIVPA